MTDAVKATPEKSGNPEMKGWLLKWTNYIKGYQRRWFVLSKGVLSYYRNQAEINHTCRGTISLHGALIHTVDSCTFVISNGGTQTFHIKAGNEVERQSWVTALELAKAKAIRAMESEDEEVEETSQVVPSQEINTVVLDLTERLENLRTCYDLITKHGLALQRALGELESNDEEALASRTKIVNERATLFRITANAMINACNDYLRSAESQGHKWSKMLQHEREQRQRLEEIVEQLAKQHTQLEQAAHLVQRHKPVVSLHTALSVTSTQTVTSDDETEFYDAEENGCLIFDSPQDPESSAFIMNVKQNAEEDGFILNVKQNPEDSTFVIKQDSDNGDASYILNSKRDMGSNRSVKRDSGYILNLKRDNDDTASTTNEYQLGKIPEQEQAETHINSSLGSEEQIFKKSSLPQQNYKHSESNVSADNVDKGLMSESTESLSLPALTEKKAMRLRRSRVPDKPNYPLNLWSIMKNCIGKELSKIPMPVNFNEPLSMLQRLVEDYEYSELLDAAAQCEDPGEQLAYISAFTASSYSSTANRTGKPFNPLLGETYEFDRTDDLGWRYFAEQVSHHPPMAAMHCEGREWVCWQEFTMTSKFRGKYLQVFPLGESTVLFPRTGRKYTWHKVATTIHNIIVGKLWIDQHGDMEIIGHNAAAGYKCVLKYLPYSYFSRDQQRRVKGVVLNPKNEVKWVVRGTWDNSIDIASVLSATGSTDSAIFKTKPYKTIWKRRLPPPDSDKYYNFTSLACQLNEMEEGVAPTDSRFRPDQRLMEEGRWDESNEEKLRLEEKQRLKRRQRESEVEEAVEDGREYPPYEPIWFTREKEEGGNNYIHVFKGTYWEHKRNQDWSMCPDLF